MTIGRQGRESARDRENDDVAVRSQSDLSEKLMHVDLVASASQLRAEDGWRANGRNAMTLVKYRDLRLVLEILRPGSLIEDSRTDRTERVVVQVIEGKLRVDAGGSALELPAGRLLALDHEIPRRIEALEESTFLLWVSYSGAST